MQTELTNQQQIEIMAQLRGTAKFPSGIAVSGLDLATNPYHRELVQRFVSTELVEAGHVRLVRESLKDLHGREKSPNTMGALQSISQPRHNSAILAAFFGKGPNQKGEFMALHPFAIHSIPGTSNLDPRDRGQIHEWVLELERAGYLVQTAGHGRTPGPLTGSDTALRTGKP